MLDDDNFFNTVNQGAKEIDDNQINNAKAA